MEGFNGIVNGAAVNMTVALWVVRAAVALFAVAMVYTSRAK